MLKLRVHNKGGTVSKKQYSEILEELGFVTAAEHGLSIIYSPNDSERGGFVRGGLAGALNTVAVDEKGEMWVTNGHTDLTGHGFRDLGKPVVH